MVPLPIQSKVLGRLNEASSHGLVSAMLTEDSLAMIVKGVFGPFERDRETFRKEIKFNSFDITHFAFQIVADESIRRFEEFGSTLLM